MKPFQTYIFELQKPHEFRIKLANVDPKTVMEQIKSALDKWELESVSAIKSLPIQEHREFPQWGPCECWTFDVKVNYPCTTINVQQAIRERAGINPDWLCVRNLNEAEYTDEAEQRGAANPNKGVAILDDIELEAVAGAQELVGPGRIKSLISELEKHTRQYDVAGKDTTVGGDKVPSYGKTTNSIPQGDTAPVGTNKNKLQGKRGQ
jgi:hypothetical protein